MGQWGAGWPPLGGSPRPHVAVCGPRGLVGGTCTVASPAAVPGRPVPRELERTPILRWVIARDTPYHPYEPQLEPELARNANRRTRRSRLRRGCSSPSSTPPSGKYRSALRAGGIGPPAAPRRRELSTVTPSTNSAAHPGPTGTRLRCGSNPRGSRPHRGLAASCTHNRTARLSRANAR